MPSTALPQPNVAFPNAQVKADDKTMAKIANAKDLLAQAAELQKKWVKEKQEAIMHLKKCRMVCVHVCVCVCVCVCGTSKSSAHVQTGGRIAAWDTAWPRQHGP